MTSTRYHPAPWGVMLVVSTSFACIVMLVVAGLVWFSPTREAFTRVIGCAAPALAIGIGLLHVVRGYAIQGRQLLVARLLWCNRIPLEGLQGVEADPGATRKSWRLAGNGGFFSYCGWHASRRLGRYRLFAMDPRRAVVLTFAHRRPVVVTPADPEAFVRDVCSAVGLARR